MTEDTTELTAPQPEPAHQGVGTQSSDETAETVESAASEFTGVESAFVETDALETQQGFLFPGDKGQLAYDARRVLALLLQRRFIEAAEDKWAWDHILKHQNDLESRFHDMFLELVVDREYGVAYKTQVRQEELNIPILLRDDSYKRAETVLLVYLRSTFRQQVSMGHGAAFVDHDELVNHAMSFFASDETNLALRHKEVNQGIDQLAREGILKEASQERYRISPIIEVLMPIERIKELTQWVQERVNAGSPEVPQEDLEEDLDGSAPIVAVVSEEGFASLPESELELSLGAETGAETGAGVEPQLSLESGHIVDNEPQLSLEGGAAVEDQEEGANK